MNTQEKLKFLADRADDHRIFSSGDFRFRFREDGKLYLIKEIHFEEMTSEFQFNQLIKMKFQCKNHSFTNDELAILRNIPKHYIYLGRNKNGKLAVISSETSKYDLSCFEQRDMSLFDNLFPSIKYEYSENILIDDYVKRGEHE